MTRPIAIAYALVAYLIFWLCAAYLIGFTADVVVPRSVDSGPSVGVAQALATNLILIALFGLQHSLMARERFARLWKRWLPESIERSTYVLVSAAMLGLLYWGWRPIPLTIWQFDGWAAAIAWTVFALGWSIVVGSTFLISHGELLGLSQALGHGRQTGAETSGLHTPGPYRLVRHPLMFGFLLAFWTTPHMTAGHLVLAAGMTAYILIGIHFEERALLRRFGSAYADYRERTPMLLPRLRPPRRRVGDEGTGPVPDRRSEDSVAPLY